jgi:hypothetical protein
MTLVKQQRRKAWVKRKHLHRKALLEALPKGGVGAEIGVWEGNFSARILDIARPAKLFLVDPWAYEEQPSHPNLWQGGGRAKSQADMDAIYQSVVQRFDQEIRSGVVEVVRESSMVAWKHFDPDAFDWVYIDGDHRFEFVKNDLERFGEL